jgi:heme/copper-type cytochrome/quinol oxidase subunit 2
LDVNVLIFIVILVGAISLGATLWVGFSKENREGDPEYENKTGTKLLRLILLYAVTIAVVIVAFFMLLRH